MIKSVRLALVILGMISLPLTAAASAQPHPLTVAVSGGFSPAFASLIPTLSQQLNYPIVMNRLPVAPLYADLADGSAQFDLIVTGKSVQLDQLSASGMIIAESIRHIARSSVVLWCPNPAVRLRVRLQDTLNDPNIRKIAASRTDSPVGQLIQRSVRIPAAIETIYAEHSLHAWRLAKSQQVDCAFTMIGMMQSTDQYQAIYQHYIEMIAAIPTNSTQTELAERLLDLLDSPMIRARIKTFGYF
ncbi:MAG: substrate-binding domain-containing protein [Pseudomonadota bacterium]|nr:substrate-binding domain-containing protein [Pseudomonadota bacterium]